jgi:hypothetical protein
VPGALTKYCKTIATTFVPEAGKDYEGALDIGTDLGMCIQQIQEMRAVENGVELAPMELSPAEPCN